MSARTVSVSVFIVVASAVAILLLRDPGRAQSAGPGAAPPAASTPAAAAPPAAPAGAPPAPGAPAGAPAQGKAQGEGGAVSGLSPADIPSPPVDPLDEAPLTEEEKARGILLIPGGGRVDLKAKTLVLPAQVCLRQGPIELFACAEGGKDHESVIRVRCRPELINLNLTLFGLKKGAPRGDGAGDRLIVRCEWEQEGKTVSVPAEELIWNMATDRPMDPVGWTHVGSQFVPEVDVETGKPTGRSVFAAVYGRTLMATFDDPAALLNTSLPEGVDDSVFTVNAKVIPPGGTRLRLVLRPPTAEELGEIRGLESQLGEERRKRQPHGKRKDDPNSRNAPPEAGEGLPK